MSPTFRLSMSWLHTWTGSVHRARCCSRFSGWAPCVFDREIDRWMMPMTAARPPPAPCRSIGSHRKIHRRARGGGIARNGISHCPINEPTFRSAYRDRDRTTRLLACRTLNRRRRPQTRDPRRGTGLTSPFHFNLHLRVWDLGYWLGRPRRDGDVALIVSGVVIHRHILVDSSGCASARRCARHSTCTT